MGGVGRETRSTGIKVEGSGAAAAPAAVVGVSSFLPKICGSPEVGHGAGVAAAACCGSF